MEEENAKCAEAGLPQIRDAESAAEVVTRFVNEMELANKTVFRHVLPRDAGWKLILRSALGTAECLTERLDWNGGGAHRLFGKN